MVISSVSSVEKHKLPMKNAGWWPITMATGQGNPRFSYFCQMMLPSAVSESCTPSSTPSAIDGPLMTLHFERSKRPSWSAEARPRVRLADAPEHELVGLAVDPCA